jgi:hypothetical protein
MKRFTDMSCCSERGALPRLRKKDLCILFLFPPTIDAYKPRAPKCKTTAVLSFLHRRVDNPSCETESSSFPYNQAGRPPDLPTRLFALQRDSRLSKPSRSTLSASRPRPSCTSTRSSRNCPHRRRISLTLASTLFSMSTTAATASRCFSRASLWACVLFAPPPQEPSYIRNRHPRPSTEKGGEKSDGCFWEVCDSHSLAISVKTGLYPLADPIEFPGVLRSQGPPPSIPRPRELFSRQKISRLRSYTAITPCMTPLRRGRRTTTHGCHLLLRADQHARRRVRRLRGLSGASGGLLPWHGVGWSGSPSYLLS